MKKGHNGKHYYHFQLQTSATTSTRTVGFDDQSHARIKHYHQTGSPVKLVNVNNRDDQNFINWSTSVTILILKGLRNMVKVLSGA